MKKIIISVSLIAAVAALVVGATTAFFSDTETSQWNTLTAGAIDLKIDNESYYNGQPWQDTSWDLRDLTIEKFFNFKDLKPGDWGEDTISLHVDNNDSWLCADVTLTSNDDNGLTEPEREDGDATDGAGNGELARHVRWYWWADDGDNVLEDNEKPIHSNVPIGTGTVALADSQTNIWGERGPLPGGSTRWIAKAWCFGNTDLISYRSVGPDGQPDNTRPTERPIRCDGSGENNITQTDSLTADISFRAEQSRNNPGFSCLSTPTSDAS